MTNELNYPHRELERCCVLRDMHCLWEEVINKGGSVMGVVNSASGSTESRVSIQVILKHGGV